MTKTTLCIISDNACLVTVTKHTTHVPVLKQLLRDWVNGDEDLDGVCAFMFANGIDLNLTDAEVNEGTDCKDMARRIREWVGSDEARAVALLGALTAIRVCPRDHPDVAVLLEDYGYDLID